MKKYLPLIFLLAATLAFGAEAPQLPFVQDDPLREPIQGKRLSSPTLPTVQDDQPRKPIQVKKMASPELPPIQDDSGQDLQYFFDGQWMPDVDPTKIGPKNFKTLDNMRYITNGLVGVKGYSAINATVISGHPELDNGFHFKKDRPSTESHVLVNADGTVHQNTTAIPSQGDFSATSLHTDASGAGLPRFSGAPYGHVAYANGVESMIWAGDEMPVSAFITSTASVVHAPTNPRDYTIVVNNSLATSGQTANIGGGIDSYTKLMMHCDGVDAGTTFADESGTHTPVAVGNAQTDTDQLKFGTASGLFDGTGDYVSIPDHADFNYGTGTLTVDLWVRFSAVTGQHSLYSQATGTDYVALFQDHDAGKLWFAVMSSGARLILEGGTWAPSVNAWYHVEVNRGWGGNANDWAITVDGVTVHTFTASVTLPDLTPALFVGNQDKTVEIDFSDAGHGITFNGTNKTLTPTSKFGSGSLLLNGTDDSLSMADHANWDIIGSNSDNKTIEAFIKLDLHDAVEIICAQFEDGTNFWGFYHEHGVGLKFYSETGGVAAVSLSGGEIADTNWHHVALIKVADEYGLYLDGTQTAYVQDSSVDTYAASLYIGQDGNAGNWFDGQVDEFRFIHSNPFTAAPNNTPDDTITVPTAAQVSDTNTKLLLHLNTMDLSGYADEYRISKGITRHRANFTPPARSYATTTQTWLVASPRPLQGFKYYVDEANATASTMTVQEWQGNAWVALSITDNTDTGPTLATTGTVTWTATNQAKVKYIEGVAAYWYQCSIDAGAATIYQTTLNAPWQDIVDLWDGVLRQPLQFQAFKSSKYEDYTLEINDSDPTYFGDLGGLLNSEHLIMMFEERTSALQWTMVAGTGSTAVASVSIYYWNGEAWILIGSAFDLTVDSGGTKSLNKSDVMSWTPPKDEEEFTQTLFGTTGYAYKLVWSATLTDGTGNCDVNTVFGIPAQLKIPPFKFPGIYKDRLLLCGYTEGGEGNRCDYSLTNSPQVFNGFETSMGGIQSLYFGGNEDLTAGIQLYNRIGSNIFIFWVALKDHETYVLTGDGPDNFQILPVSMNIGCPAPLTLVTAEMGFEIASDVQRHVAIWLSHTGPVFYDGAVIYQIPGIKSYFDAADDNYIGAANIETAFAWFDNVYKEYNLRISNLWFVYDLARKRWYEKNPDPCSEKSPLTEVKATTAANDDGFYFDWPVGLVYYEAGDQFWNYVALGKTNVSKECSPVMIFHLDDAIPARATITSATIEFKQRLSGSGSGTATGKIYLEKSAAPTFKTTAGDANAQTLTTAFTDWSTSVEGAAGTIHTTSDFTAVVQEVLDAHGAISDVHVVIVENATPDSTNVYFEAFGSYLSTAPPELTIVYDEECGELPTCAFPVKATDGNQYNYSGHDNGFMYRLEDGYSWGGSTITHVIETGDFWPSKNLWDVSIIDRFKFVGEMDDATGDVVVTHYSDGATSGTDIETITRATGTARFFRVTASENLEAWAHRFKFTSTSSDQAGTDDRRFSPLGWGYRSRFIRKDQ